MRNKVHQLSTRNGLRAVMLIIAFLLALAACGSTSTSAGIDADEPAGADAPEQDSEAQDEVQSDGEAPVQEVTTSVRPAGSDTIDVLGGINIELPQEVRVIAGGGCVALEPTDVSTSSPFNPSIVMADVMMSGGLVTTPIATVEEFLALYGDQPTPEPTGETVSVLGQELNGYRVENAYPDGPPPDPNFLNCTTDPDGFVEFWFLPAVYSDIFIAETDAGLRVVTASGFTEGEQQLARELFDQVIPTLTASE